MNDFWHLLYLLTIFHCATSRKYFDQRYLDELKSLNDSEDKHRSNEVISFEIDQIRGNTASKWIGPNGQLSTSHFVTVPEATELMKKGARRMVENKQKAEAVVVEQRNIDNSKLSNQQDSNFKSNSTSKNKIRPPLFETNVPKTSNKLTKKPIPFYMTTRYFKLPKEIKKRSHNYFKRQAIDLRERAIPFGSNNNQKFQLGNFPGTQTATGRGQINEGRSKNIHGTHRKIYVDDLPVPSNCPPLDPLLNSSLHTDTDESCGQNLQGWTKDPDCVCTFFVAEHNEEGCPTKFHTLCYRPNYQKVNRAAKRKSFDPRASGTPLGQNTATHSSGHGHRQ